MVIRSPYSILEAGLHEFAALLPGVRLAEIDPVHDARVATRRLRELLPIIDGRPVFEESAARLKKAGRAIGKVRELDVLDSLIDRLETRASFARETVSRLRHEVHTERLRQRRRMVRRLERLDLDDLEAHLSDALRRTRPHPRWLDRTWLRRLKARTAERAAATRAAIDRASGVYFPNRSHAARIAIKKLRYAVEIAAETHLWEPPHLLKDLRRVQEVLGQIHDLQVLLERIEALAADQSLPQQPGWLLDLLRAEIDDAHRGFLERLARLRDAVDACEQWASGHRRLRRGLWFSAPMIAASALVVPILAAARDDDAPKHLLTALQSRR